MSLETFNMTDEEFEVMFSKFDILDLEILYDLTGFCYGYETEDLKKALKKRYDEEEKTCDEEYFLIRRHVTVSPSRLKNKTKLLTGKELDFFDEFIETVSLCLDSIKHYDVSESKREISQVEDSISYEKEKRANSKQKIKINSPKKNEP